MASGLSLPPAPSAGEGVDGRGPLIECVPNVSEGRDPTIIRCLAESVERGGARLVDVHSDFDHHRSVFTFIGPTAEVERSLLELAREAVRLIDLRGHRGVHPRVGAIDVVPFVPLCGSTMRDAVAAAHAVGLAFAAECDVPVFFYGDAAARRDRRELPAVRRGGFERLTERLCAPGWRPDAGPSIPHPTAGASVIGARGPLVAFNALLDTDNVDVAGAIARAIRESSGGLPRVRAMGVFLASRRAAQVSMNLLDYRVTPPQNAAERIEAEARSYGTSVREYELVGCAPLRVFEHWPAGLAPLADLKPAQLLESSLFVTHV